MGGEERITGPIAVASESNLRQLLEEILADETGSDWALLSDDRRASLATAVEALPRFAAIRGKHLNAGRSSTAFSTDLWAFALFRLAREQGVDEGLCKLEEFLGQEARDGRIVLLISSVFVTVPIPVAGGITLIPLDALHSRTLDSYPRTAKLVGRHRQAHTAALVVGHTIRPAFIPETQRVDADAFSGQLTQLDDARRCLCFFGPSTPVHVADWWEPADDAFNLEGESWFGPNVELLGYEHSHVMTGEELHKYRDYFARFSALPEHNKRVLRVAIDRVNRALRRHWSVDAAIELGIALEAFFLSDVEQSELTYRLQVRCAWWLGETPEERTQLMEWARVLYKCRSEAVHTGYLAEKLQEKWAKSFRGLDTRKFIHEGCARVLRAIALALERGMPDWSALVVGRKT
jgi:hypothetical protein